MSNIFLFDAKYHLENNHTKSYKSASKKTDQQRKINIFIKISNQTKC